MPSILLESQLKKQKGIFVTGTDTNVGKTWIGQMIIRQLGDDGVEVIPRKPVESGWQKDHLETTDAWLLAKAAGKEQELNLVCVNRFKAPLSPVRAAQLAGKTLQLDTIKQQCFDQVEADDFLYVEGAGGFFSPLVSNGLNADLAKALNLPVLLVAEDKLGCINHVLLTIAAIKSYNLTIVAVILNVKEEGSGDTKMNNHEDLEVLIDIPVFQIGYCQDEVSEELLLLLSS